MPLILLADSSGHLRPGLGLITIVIVINCNCNHNHNHALENHNYHLIMLVLHIAQVCKVSMICPLLAYQYLQTPPSNGPVERLFFIAGKIFMLKRCRLTDELFEKLMFIRCNEICDS